MPKYLAIEWDDHELRAVVASTSGRNVTVEQADAIDLPTEDGKAPSPEVIGKALGDWVRDHGARCTTLVAVGRASIELRRFTLPPAPDDELPEMVRFQAQREFSSLTDESPLDFLPLSGDASSPRQVLAAAISPELLSQIRKVNEAAGLRAERIVLRPCATAAIVRQTTKAEQPADAAALIVDPLPDEVDLSVLVDGKVAFIRTVRLPRVEADEKQFRPLMGELRRTMAAFHNQFSEVRIASVTVCGDPEQRTALAEAIEGEFSLPTNLVHPLEVVGGTSQFKKNMPDQPGRFAPLVGMVLDEAAGSHAIDFLNPRKKPEQRTSRLTYALAAAAALMLLGGYAWWQYDRISQRRLTVEALDEQIQKETEFYEEYLQPVVTRAERFDTWEASDVPWLDELNELSIALRPRPHDADDFPVDEDVVTTSLQATGADQGGRIKFDLAAKKRDLVAEITDRVRDYGDALLSQGVPAYEQVRSGYPWKIAGATVNVTKSED